MLIIYGSFALFFFFKQKTAYEMRISDWSSYVCSSDLGRYAVGQGDALHCGQSQRPCGVAGVVQPWSGGHDHVVALTGAVQVEGHAGALRRDVDDAVAGGLGGAGRDRVDRKSTRLKSSH